MWKLKLRPLNSSSGNICYEFLVVSLCSVALQVKQDRGLLDRGLTTLCTVNQCTVKTRQIIRNSVNCEMN